MNDSLRLRDATVQEIQLELIRRTRFNAFDGERIYASLMKHRAYWQAVLLDRPGLRSEERRVGKECRSRWWRDRVRKKGGDTQRHRMLPLRRRPDRQSHRPEAVTPQWRLQIWGM